MSKIEQTREDGKTIVLLAGSTISGGTTIIRHVFTPNPFGGTIHRQERLHTIYFKNYARELADRYLRRFAPRLVETA